MGFDIRHGDCLDVLRSVEAGTVNTCITSPPYFGLRDYGHYGQIGLENTPDAYVQKLVEVFREVHRVLRDDGTLWLNLGDSYFSMTKGMGGTKSSGLNAKRNDDGSLHDARKSQPTHMPVRLSAGSLPIKPKDLIGIPWRVAFALQDDGWYLRQDIIWHKPNPMPESVTDRCTKAHEYIFLLSKNDRYYFDNEAIKEPAIHKGRVVSKVEMDHGSVERRTMMGFTNHDVVVENRNKRSVWTVATKPYSGAHFAVFPPELIRPCILAGCHFGGTVLDPFNGSGTTGQVALEEGRNYIGIELNPDYIALSKERLSKVQPRMQFDQPNAQGDGHDR